VDWLKSFVEKFDIQRWWKAAFFAGLAILVTAIAAKDDCFKVIGLGIMVFGWGEWLNHRMETEIRHGGTLTTYERINRPLGLAIAGLGVVVVALGLYCLFAKLVSP
jgi:hypothetical protein